MVTRQREQHTVTIGTPFYSCTGCTVAFTDPHKFTRQQKVTKRHGPHFAGARSGSEAGTVTPLHRPRKPRQ